MKRVIVCGSRKWRNRKQIADRLFDLALEFGHEITIVHGAAPGADRIAHQEAEKGGLIVEPWDYRPFISETVSGKRAPLKRNSYMASLGADLCIAFWDGSSTGTQDMIRKATKASIPIEIVLEQ